MIANIQGLKKKPVGSGRVRSQQQGGSPVRH